MRFKFEKEILGDLEKSIKYEWLEYNRKGAYSSSTIIGMNTRREHGLLNIPHQKDEQTAVILSKLEESIFVDNHLYEISTNQYSKNIFPEGYHFLEKFSLDPFPSFYFSIEDRLIQKSLFLHDERNVLVVRYTLKNQGRPVKLVIKPFLAGRNNQELAAEIQGLNTDSYLGQNFVRWAPRPDIPELNVHYNRGEFIPATLWYHNFIYRNDDNSDSKRSEDLLNPGFFQAELQPYQNLDLFITTEDVSDLSLEYEQMFREQASLRISSRANEPLSVLQNGFSIAADSSKNTIPISFLKPDRSLRNLLFCMPALLTVKENGEQFISLFQKILDGLEQGLLPKEFPYSQNGKVYQQADTPLWLINNAYSYFLHTHDDSVFSDDMIQKFKSVIEAFTKGTSANIYTDKTGLVFSGDKTTDSGWFPLKDKTGGVLRYGYLLEVNALWYNALKIMEEIFLLRKKKRQATKYERMAEKVQRSFKSLFYDEKTMQVYDFVGTQHHGSEFRLNQIIPLTLPFSVLEPQLAKRVLMKIDEELVTPYGLRVLSKKQNRFAAVDLDKLSRKNIAFYEQAIWPWTISLYVQAAKNYKQGSAHLSQDLKKYFQPVFELQEEGLLGFFPEAVYLNDVLHQFGIQDSVLTMANITHAFTLLQEA